MDASIIIADYAAANDGGKYTLVGAGITEIFTKKLPCIHPSMFILVRFQVTPSDKGKNRIEVRIVGEKGAIFKAQANLDVGQNHDEEKHLPFPFHLQNTKFEEEGVYNIEVLVNGGEPKATHPLKIRPVAPQKA